jgi:hypothetical protein
MKRKAKKKKLMNDTGANAGPACAPARSSPDRPATATSTATLATNWNDLSASQALALGGGLPATTTHSEGSSPWQQYPNHLGRPTSALAADATEGRHYPRASSASNVQSSSQQPFATPQGAAAHSTTAGLEELTSRLYSSSSQANSAQQQLAVNPFLQHEAQRNQAFAVRSVAYRGESFPPDSHERIRFDQQQEGMLPAPHEFPPDGRMAGANVGGSHVWLPYHPQQGATHRLQDGGMGISSISSSSSRQANQPNEHVFANPLSMARQAASASFASPRAGTSNTMLSSSSSADDWIPGEDPADELAAGASDHHHHHPLLPMGAMSPLHFGEHDETSSSSD